MTYPVDKIARAYAALLLLVPLLSLSPIVALASLALLVLFIASMRLVNLGHVLSIQIATFLIAPILIQPLASAYPITVLLGLLSLPMLILIDRSLKAMAVLNGKKHHSKQGRALTATAKSLLATASLALFAYLILANYAGASAGAMLLAYSLIAIMLTMRKIPAQPFAASRPKLRILVRDIATIPFTIKSSSGLPLLADMEPGNSWFSLDAQSMAFTPNGSAAANLAITPPLAAPSSVVISASAVDPRGLILTGQEIDAVDLHAIPRAAYAEWLAKKYLEQTAPGYAPSMATPPIRSQKPSRRGVEYYGSRAYQPGDSIKDVDWRQTFRLQELVVKEFSGGQVQPAVIAADLVAGDPEDADSLAYDFVTTALTMAKQGVPSAIASYDDEGVVEVTDIANPREILKKSLLLTKRIKVKAQGRAVLNPADPLRLRRDSFLLGRSSGEEAKRAARLLRLEGEAIQEGASVQPAILALKKMSRSAG